MVFKIRRRSASAGLHRGGSSSSRQRNHRPTWRNRFTTGLWQHADFLRFWAAQGVSQFGTQISLLALPLLAALTLDASPFEMGLLAAIETAPFLLVGLFVGVWVDRLRRCPIMVIADLGRGFMLLTIPIAAAFDVLSIWLLYVVAALVGTLTVFFDVSYVSYLPSLVRRAQLVDANSKLEGTASIAQVGGPGLAGVLVGLITSPFAILIDAISFFLSAFFLTRIRTPETTPVPGAERSNVWRDIAEGIRIVRHDPVLRALTARSAVNSFAGWIFLSIYLLYMSEDLGLGATAIGLVFAAGGVGAFIGSTLAAPMARRFGQGPTMIIGQFLFGVTGMLVPLAVLLPSVALPLVIASEIAQWLTLLICTVIALSLRQTLVPDHLQGRVGATMRSISVGAQTIGALLGGVLGGLVGLPMTLVIGEIGMFFAVGALLLAPIWSIREAAPPRTDPEGVVATAA